MSDQPYRDAAEIYWQAGWRGVLPVFERGKRWTKRLSLGKERGPDGKPIAGTGWTGHEGRYPSWPDVLAWRDGPEGDGNIALRMPDDVIGIDVDDYGAKRGGTTLRELTERAGVELPPTWRSSARDDGVSGIYFFRVPAGLAWPGEAGPNIEIIQRAHRYAVTWPSWNPDAEAQYVWRPPGGYGGDAAYAGAVMEHVPSPDELPDLPAAWVEMLSRGIYVAQRKEAVDDATEHLRAWNHAGTCRMLRHAVSQSAAGFRHGSRHEALNRGVLAVVRLGEQGHRGLSAALHAMRAEFRSATDDRSRGAARSEHDVAGEWDRALVGAVALVLGEPSRPAGSPPVPCTCDDDPAQLVPDPAVDDGAPRSPAQRLSPGPASAAQVESPAGQPDPAQGNSAGDVKPAGEDLQSGGANASGLVLPGPLPSTQPPSAYEIERERQRIYRAVQIELDSEEAARNFRAPVYTRNLREELSLPEIDEPYAIPELMPQSANVLLAAQFKAGKTTLLNNLARSMADGSPFLGKFQPSQMSGRIALFNYEVSRQQYARWLREHDIINQERITVLPLRGFSLPITTPHAQDWVVEWLKRHEIEMWIPDPFARAFIGCGDNENDNSQVGRFLDAVDIVKERAGVPNLVMATHTGRAEMAAGQERARGATRLDDWADVRWLLTKDAQDRRYFRATGRDVEFAETALSFEPSTRLLTLGEGNRAATRSSQIQDAVMAVIRANAGISVTALRTGVREFLGSVGTDAITEAVGILKRAERIRVVVEGASTKHFLTNPNEILQSLIP